MALVLMDFVSFETGTIGQAVEGTYTGAGLVTTPAPPSVYETYCLELAATTGTVESLRLGNQTIDITEKQMIGGIYQFSHLPPDANQTTLDIITFETSASVEDLVLRVTRTDASNHKLELIDAAGSVAASAANPFTANTWHRVEIVFEPDSSSTAEEPEEAAGLPDSSQNEDVVEQEVAAEENLEEIQGAMD